MFADRKDAGRRLAEALWEYKSKNALILALPRGGVPVGFEVAQVLKCPLNTIVARKIGAPGHSEYALGAIAPGVEILDAPRAELEEVIREEEVEMRRRMEAYKSGAYSEGAKPETVILVDDGIATGRTARAALAAVRKKYSSAKIIFAAPVGAPDSVAELRKYADEVICLETPSDFDAVGEWYEHFDQTTDNEVIDCLEKAKAF